MHSTVTQNKAALVLCLVAFSAFAHPTGFHKRLTITLTSTRLSVLMVMDVDSGERCLLLREAMDSNRDGVLAGNELTVLKERLLKLATRPLKVSLSTAPLNLTVKESKVSLRGDIRANDSPLSVAVLLEMEHSNELKEGMALEIEDISPDQSTIAVQVFQAGAKEGPFEKEVPSGTKSTVRVGRLGN